MCGIGFDFGLFLLAAGFLAHGGFAGLALVDGADAAHIGCLFRIGFGFLARKEIAENVIFPLAGTSIAGKGTYDGQCQANAREDVCHRHAQKK